MLDGVEIAPGTQIYTGQDGTTLIPPPFPTSALNESYSSGVRDSTGQGPSIMTGDREGRGGGRDRDRGQEEGNSMDGDRREDEAGSRPEHPAEFYNLPVPQSIRMDIAEDSVL